jgi:2-polyprenyl-3-methyl-5-hydroxy-6-metoxy-1,4-benzoquinol methylase
MTVQAADVFGDSYAELYDSFYSGKDYVAECENLVALAVENGLAHGGRILDVGCGTGRHASLLSDLGFHVTGTDISEAMLEIARSRASTQFEVAAIDALASRAGEFDLVYSLFDVLSYQVSISGAADFMARLAQWARPGGIVVVDAWHLAGLVCDPPVDRRQEISLDDGRHVTRLSTPTIDWVEGITDVEYSLQVSENGLTREFSEVHRMRAFTKAELEMLVEGAGMSVVDIVSSPSFSERLTESDWHIGVIARRNSER